MSRAAPFYRCPIDLRHPVFVICLVFSLALAPAGLVAAERVDPFGRICTAPPTAPGQKTSQQAAVSDSTLCQEKNPDGQNPLFGSEGVMTKIINIMSLVIAIVAIISIMIAGLRYVLGGNNPQDLSNARTRIIYALVALLVAVSAQAVVRFVLNKL